MKISQETISHFAIDKLCDTYSLLCSDVTTRGKIKSHRLRGGTVHLCSQWFELLFHFSFASLKITMQWTAMLLLKGNISLLWYRYQSQNELQFITAYCELTLRIAAVVAILFCLFVCLFADWKLNCTKIHIAA